MTQEKQSHEGANIRGVFDYATSVPVLEDLVVNKPYPNPVNDVVKMNVRVGGDDLNLVLYDLLGREIFKERRDDSPCFYEVSSSLGGLVPGTYVLGIDDGLR